MCVFSAITDASAQTTECTQKLANAQARFDIGNLPGIPEDLKGCIDSKSFSPEQSIQAHKLITLVYLYQDDQESADIWMAKLLAVDPEHKLDPSADPNEIILLKEKFLYKPIFRVSLSISGNQSTYRELTKFGPGNLEFDKVTASPGIGLGGSALLEREVYPGVDVGTGISFLSRSFSIEKELVYAINKMTVEEAESWLELPLFLKYTYYGDGDNKWNPYVLAGGSLGYILSGKLGSPERSNEGASVTVGSVDLVALEQRNKFNYSAMIGLGAKIRLKTHFFFLEAKYVYGLSNLVNDDNRFAGSLETLYLLGYVDSNFSLNGLMATFGYQRSIYNPRKIKK